MKSQAFISRRSFRWAPSPPGEIPRLARLLQTHLRSDGPQWNPKQRLRFVERLLRDQGGTCFMAGGDARYCWNNPKDWGNLKYLKLQWGHRKPVNQGGTGTPANLYLLCARCNNHLQTSRRLKHLIPEFEHKLAVLKSHFGRHAARRSAATAGQGETP